MAKEIVIYCDESVRDGVFFSNFYGGLLVDAVHLQPVVARLEACKRELGLTGEMKWEGVTPSVEERYRAMMTALFGEVGGGRVKVRIMFTQNRDRPSVSEAQRAARYHLLYYQFIKHGFGLEYATAGSMTRVRLLLDTMPSTSEQIAQFRGYVGALSHQPRFRNAGVIFPEAAIGEIDSKRHILAQCLDVVLGSMAFRLNDGHKAKPAGSRVRGKRTRAKERVYKHINTLIRILYPNFNIGASTGTVEPSDRWAHAYRHWCFVPKTSVRDDSLTKKRKRKAP